MNNESISELIEMVCSTISNGTMPLGITKNEALFLMERLVSSKDFSEKIRKIKSNRKEIKLVQNLTIRKYFETLGHSGVIERMCFDNSSKFAFSGGADGIIKCWNIEDGMLIRSLYGHSNVISDLCISKDGEVMVSVDYQGKLNIWDLNEFRILHSVVLSNEAIFCEFIYSSFVNEKDMEGFKEEIGNEKKQAIEAYNIFIILADGIVKTIEFSKESILQEKENSFMFGESIKAICITDGGRFVICGGWWPFFLIYDTQDLGSIIVVENFRIQTLCAAKNSLKFAASTENQIYSYTFYCEGTHNQGNFNKRKSSAGYWKKNVNKISDEYYIEWLCYLPSFLLVASCTDNIIRVYEDDNMILSFSSEVGSIYSHPFENIFAVVGSRLQIYQILGKHDWCGKNADFQHTYASSTERISFDRQEQKELGSRLIFSENIYVNLNDCQFSEDGKYFITCDDQGYIKAYSVNSSIKVPEEQFFLSDIVRAQSDADAQNDALTITNDSFSQTCTLNQQNNPGWRKTQYLITAVDIPQSLAIENLAALSLNKDKMNEEKFKSLYLSAESLEGSVLYPTENDITEESGSDDETLGISNISDTVSSNEDSETCESFEEEDSSPVRILRRASVDRKIELPVRTERILRRRHIESLSGSDLISNKIEISTSDSSPSSNKSKSSKNKRLQKLRKFKNRSYESPRKLMISSDSSILSREIGEINERILVSDEDGSLINSRKRGFRNNLASQNAPKLPLLRRNIASNIFDRNNSFEGASGVTQENSLSNNFQAEKSHTRSARREQQNNRKLEISSTDSKNHISANSSISYARVGSSPKSGYEADNYNLDRSKRTLRSSLSVRNKAQDDFSSEKSGSHRIRLRSRNRRSKDLDISQIAYSNDDLESNGYNGIDEAFENTLCQFSERWIKNCSIYIGTEVYFNTENYKIFMSLEQRIKYDKAVPTAGFHTVSGINIRFVGRIPYFVMKLDDSLYTVKFYEYPDSKGIVCSKDQYIVRDGWIVRVCDTESFAKGKIASSDDMRIKIDKTWYLKSVIATEYKPLELEPIRSASRTAKALFGKERGSVWVFPKDYSVVNFKLGYNLYKNKDEFLYDLKSICDFSKSLGQPYSSVAREVYENYL